MTEAGGAVHTGNLEFMAPEEIENGGEIIDISPETDLVPLVFDASAKAKVLVMVASLKEKYREVPADLTIKKNYKVAKRIPARRKSRCRWYP